MEDKIVCPNCHKRNEVHKFCVYCGHKLLNEGQIRLILDNPEPYCLNCGRPVKKGQKECECGYKFSYIDCPQCNSKNSYTSRFCTACGKKLWTSNVYDYKYPKRLFEKHLLGEVLPSQLRNTSLYKRRNMDFKLEHNNGFEWAKSQIDKNLCEIGSRWKVVSPNYCINCISIIKPRECSCKKCGSISFADKKRVDFLKTKNKYTKPNFHDRELKWTPKLSNVYFGSLAPAIAESQFEYRERLKWEFAENNYHKRVIIYRIKIEREEEERKKRLWERRRQEVERRRLVEDFIRQYGGCYCGSSCRHFHEQIITNHGISADYTDDMCGVDYICSIGHSPVKGYFCKDFEL